MIAGVFSEAKNRTVANLARVNVFDPQLAKKLYTQYNAQLEAERDHPAGYHSLGSTWDHLRYAYYLSGINPMEARLVLETEYRGMLSMTRQGEANTTLYTLVQAMCTLDWKRAQQMFDKVNSKTDPRFRENFGRINHAVHPHVARSTHYRVVLRLVV